ncbi:hypothetical protein ABES25_24000, partial [Bacillus gobiensis]|uniref:hypothetical protein n=1 Tax=Bacillus gobiensis TaxID=1441095 RepID=UPI003D1F0AA4
YCLFNVDVELKAHVFKSELDVMVLYVQFRLSQKKIISECHKSKPFPVLVYERLNSEGRYGG